MLAHRMVNPPWPSLRTKLKRLIALPLVCPAVPRTWRHILDINNSRQYPVSEVPAGTAPAFCQRLPWPQSLGLYTGGGVPRECRTISSAARALGDRHGSTMNTRNHPEIASLELHMCAEIVYRQYLCISALEKVVPFSRTCGPGSRSAPSAHISPGE